MIITKMIHQIFSAEPNEKGRMHGMTYIYVTGQPWEGMPTEQYTEEENMALHKELEVDPEWYKEQKRKQIESERELANIILNC